MSTTTTTTSKFEPLHSRIWSGKVKPGDDKRLAKALGVDPENAAQNELCTEALGGDVHAALELWRTVLPGQSLRIQVSHTPSALKMCAHLLKQVEGE
jgi:hypothetical protein